MLHNAKRSQIMLLSDSVEFLHLPHIFTLHIFLISWVQQLFFFCNQSAVFSLVVCETITGIDVADVVSRKNKYACNA